ncbi:MAG TPA: D-amino-acid oxidase, partial [Xanthomonadaceae bacterium]|nr:D-amino-acid oxidase [Xanthomonadaceae bacterium]
RAPSPAREGREESSGCACIGRQTFDLIVVGAGIVGAACADAAA